MQLGVNRFPPAVDKFWMVITGPHLTYINFLLYVLIINLTPPFTQPITADPTMENVDLITELLTTSAFLGSLTAELNWIRAGDPFEISNEIKNKIFDIHNKRENLRFLLSNAELIYSESELSTLREECSNTEKHHGEVWELYISLKNKPPGFNYNDKALVIKTEKNIPLDIQMGLSFGWKFLFPFITTKSNIHETLAQLESCIEASLDVTRQHRAFTEITHIIGKKQLITMDENIQWLRFVSHRIGNFFEENDDIFASRSDKGAHTVILNTVDYDNALEKLLQEDCYMQITNNPLSALINMETKILKILGNNYKSRDWVGRGYQPALLTLAKFYGLPKIHKPGFCLRPIMALNCSPGNFLGKIFNKMLNACFPQSGYHLRDSYDAKKQFDGVRIAPDEIIVSFDVVSMYTNIPNKLAFDIVFERHADFYTRFGMGKSILKRILDFLLNDCTVFTALGRTYKQTRGLPMGGSISTNLARLVMDRVIHKLRDIEPDITFIRVFVDDTVAVIRSDGAKRTLQTLNMIEPGITFTCETENDDREINFLNLTLCRENNSITTNWYRKSYASGRLLPYFSSHKRTTIMETAIAFIQTVLTLSDGKFFHSNKPKVIETLRNNGFPESNILSLMNNHYTLMRKRSIKTKIKNPVYELFPHAIPESRKIKRVLHALKRDNIIYSDSTRNSRINFIRTRKTKTPAENRGNIIVSTKCQCGQRVRIVPTGFNENGGMVAQRLRTKFSTCSNHLHSFTNFRFHKGLAYNGQTRTLSKYVAWIRGKGVSFGEIGFPNKHFQTLIRRK